MYKKVESLILIFSIVFLNFGFLFLAPHEASATGNLTALSDTVSNLTASTVANHLIKFTTPTGVASGATIILTFDNSTSISSSLVYTDLDLQDDGVDVTLAGTASGTTWGAVRTSATVITFTNGTTAVAAGSVVTIKIGTNATGGVNQITNGTAGTTTLRVTGTFGDTGVMSMAIVTNGVVSVSAQVLSTLSFSVSANSIYFGILRTGGVCFAQSADPGNNICPTQTEAEAFNMTAATNGTSGYTITVEGDTLKSGSNSIAALTTNTASSPGNEQFGMRINGSGSGTGTVSAPYLAAGYAYTGTATTPATVATASTSTLSNTYSVRYMANISSVTKAGNYTTSHTYVATGNF